MGAKTWMLAYADCDIGEALQGGAALDRDATVQLATRLFPKETLLCVGVGSLAWTSPSGAEILIGCFPGFSIVAAKEFGIDYPSQLPTAFLADGRARTIYLHAMHSAVDWAAFAKWHQGKLIRSLSLSPDSGILEDIGPHLPFEEPFWSGRHPADLEEDSDYPFPFHPLEMGEAALRAFFGYHLEGPPDKMLFDPKTVSLLTFKRSRPWYRLW